MSNPFTAVGVKNVSPATPAPTIFVNDIPGVSSELATALRTSDAPAAAAVWDKVRWLGLDKLSSMIENELSKSADFRYEVARTGLPPIAELTAHIGGIDSYIGVNLKATYSRYGCVRLDSLAVTSQAEQDTQTKLVVWDRSGIYSVLIERDVILVPGYNDLAIDLSIPMVYGRQMNLFVGLDGDNVSLYDLGVVQGWDGSDTSYSLSPCTMFGGVISQLLSNSYVLLNASVRNELGQLIARYADRLGWAYAYVCASLLMSEKLASPNFNLYTNTNRGYTEEQIPGLLDEAVTRVRPIARDMLKELSRTETVTPKADGPYDAGYSVGSYC